MSVEDRESEIQAIHRKYKFFYQISGGILLVVVGILIGLATFPSDKGYLTNLYTSVLSIIVTVCVLDLLARRREERRYKADLIYRMGSSVNSEAIRAAEELRQHGWLEDGSLLRARLPNANLRNANLKKANLERAYLIGGKLRKAVLDEAKLEHANLWSADLREAMLHTAVLKGAFLFGADLRGTYLILADLRGANLQAARLKGATLELRTSLITLPTFFDENTLLPDGDNWTPQTDMRRFTDPSYPEFWRFEEHVIDGRKFMEEHTHNKF